MNFVGLQYLIECKGTTFLPHGKRQAFQKPSAEVTLTLSRGKKNENRTFRNKKRTFLAFFCQKICSCQKKAVPLHRQKLKYHRATG
jgi:hypothetical protein